MIFSHKFTKSPGIIYALILSTSSLMAELTSPDGRYTVEYREGPFVKEAVIVLTKTKAVLHVAVASGYNKSSYQEVSWSPDSKHLAVVTRGTKTTTHLKVYELSNEAVTQLRIPDYQLNLLGRHNLVTGGRYQFVKKLQWVKGGIQFNASGSLIGGVSNPKDYPKDWYFYDVMLKVEGRLVELKTVKTTPHEK